MLAEGLFHVLFCSLSYCCVYWFLSRTVITLFAKKALAALLFFGLWLTYILSFIVLSVSLVGCEQRLRLFLVIFIIFLLLTNDRRTMT